jgi:hypothetical protein
VTARPATGATITPSQQALLARLAASRRDGLLVHPGRDAAVDAYEQEVDDLFALHALGYASRPVTQPNGTYPRGRYHAVHAQITDAGRRALERS